MDQVTAIRRRISLDNWKNIITECRSSGMPVYRWCKENGICEQTYYKYLKKLREQELSTLSLALNSPHEEMPSTSFKKLEVQPQPSCSKTAVVVHLKNASVEVNDGASQQTIQAVLLALQNIC